MVHLQAFTVTKGLINLYNRVIRSLCQALGSTNTRTSAYHPQKALLLTELQSMKPLSFARSPQLTIDVILGRLQCNKVSSYPKFVQEAYHQIKSSYATIMFLRSFILATECGCTFLWYPEGILRSLLPSGGSPTLIWLNLDH